MTPPQPGPDSSAPAQPGPDSSAPAPVPSDADAHVDRVGADQLLLRDGAGRELGRCRLRRHDLVWVIEQCEVVAAERGRGRGRRLVTAAHRWAADEGAVRVHVRPEDPAFWQRLGYLPLVSAGGELTVGLPLELAGPEATHALGRALARDLRAGDLVLLSGPLGAGKTALTQGIGAGLGVRGPVTSPTFVLARRHLGPVPLLHVDVYRLRDGGGRVHLDDLDLDQALQDSVTVVEWGEGLIEDLAESRLEVHLERPAEQSRVARVRAVGPRWSAFS